ncbi:MAG TPA: septum formation initiator family protein [Solirubrobacteraceae bacterium]
MPSARSASAAPRRQPRPRQPAARPRVVVRAPKLRVRWERVGRFGLLFVLAVVIGLYVEHTMSYFSIRAQASQQQAIVDRLAHQNAALIRQQRSLNDPVTIINEARALGMVRPGEQSYVITGSPSH